MTKISNVKTENGGAKFITGRNKAWAALIVELFCRAGRIQCAWNLSLRDRMTYSNLKDLRKNKNADVLSKSLKS